MNNLFGFDLDDFNRSFPGVYDVYSSKCNMPSPTSAQKEECCKVACDVCKTGNCITGGVSTCLLNCPPDLPGPVRPTPTPVGPPTPSPDGPSPVGPPTPSPSPDGPYGPSPDGPDVPPSPNGPVVNPVVPPDTPPTPPSSPDVGLFSNLSTSQIVTLSVGVIIILALLIMIVRNMTSRRSISFY